jgi:hypothetical protein
MRAEGSSFADRVFMTRDGKPKLVRCAVLFVDLLGVRAMNRSRRVASHLVALERAVSKTYRDFLKPDSPWPAAFFSDTLVLAAPVEQHGGEESAIGGLVLQAAWLQLNFIDAGFFLRGGLSLGRIHIRDGLVFGPALVEAYDLERMRAVSPRIVLSSDVDASQRADLRFYAQPESSPQGALLLCDGDGHTFVNYLGLLFDEPDDVRQGLGRHRDTVLARLQEHRADKHLWEKYRWVAEYHNAVVARTLPGEQRLLVDGQAMRWPFTPFA